MTRRMVLLLIITLLAAGEVGVIRSALTAERRPNIIIVLTDDQVTVMSVGTAIRF